jgi:hypothetical protein
MALVNGWRVGATCNSDRNRHGTARPVHQLPHHSPDLGILRPAEPMSKTSGLICQNEAILKIMDDVTRRIIEPATVYQSKNWIPVVPLRTNPDRVGDRPFRGYS